MHFIKHKFLIVLFSCIITTLPLADTQKIDYKDLKVLISQAEANLIKVLPDDLKTLHLKNKNKIFWRIMEFAELVAPESKRQLELGTLSGKELATIISKNMDNLQYQEFFINEDEKALIRYASPMLLLPELRAMLCELDDLS